MKALLNSVQALIEELTEIAIEAIEGEQCDYDDTFDNLQEMWDLDINNFNTVYQNYLQDSFESYLLDAVAANVEKSLHEEK